MRTRQHNATRNIFISGEPLIERATERALTNCQNIGRVAKHSQHCCRR